MSETYFWIGSAFLYWVFGVIAGVRMVAELSPDGATLFDLFLLATVFWIVTPLIWLTSKADGVIIYRREAPPNPDSGEL